MDTNTLRFFGGKVGWCYSKAANYWCLCLLYWIVKQVLYLVSQIYRKIKLLYTSGFVLEGRGRHFVYNINKGRAY